MDVDGLRMLLKVAQAWGGPTGWGHILISVGFRGGCYDGGPCAVRRIRMGSLLSSGLITCVCVCLARRWVSTPGLFPLPHVISVGISRKDGEGGIASPMTPAQIVDGRIP